MRFTLKKTASKENESGIVHGLSILWQLPIVAGYHPVLVAVNVDNYNDE
jgi:hypothetical protein